LNVLLIAIIAVVGLMVLIFLYSGFYIVDTDSKALVLRFGKFLKTAGPGLHVKIPFGIDTVYEFRTEKKYTLEFGFRTVRAGKDTIYEDRPEIESLMLTGDLNCAVVEWTVQYQIVDPKDYFINLEDVPGSIRDVSDSLVRRLVGDRSVDEVITIGRQDLASEAKRELQSILDQFGCGVRITNFNLQDTTPPERVKAAFDAVNEARQEADRIINEAKGERNKLIPAARGKRERQIKEAEGYYEKKVKEATGEAAALLSQYAEYVNAKEETERRLYLETMEDILQKTPKKVIVDQELRGLVPLLELRRKEAQ
jgi:membrane protease subunit HflK